MSTTKVHNDNAIITNAPVNATIGAVNLSTSLPCGPSPSPPSVFCQSSVEICLPGLLLPYWASAKSPIYVAIVYSIGLAYLLFGVSIITDRLVSATQVMSVHKRSVTIKLKSGAEKTIRVLIWHPVVASLTFEVVGTCSAEILLPLIEVLLRDFSSNDLGPSLVIGSGAFHLFIVTAVCLLSVQESSGKPIRDLHLYFTTGAFSIFSSLWIYLALDHISPSVIELSEAVFTLAMFPILVATAWIIARRFPCRLFDKLSAYLDLDKHTSTITSTHVPSLPTTNESFDAASVGSSYSDEEHAEVTENYKRRKLAAARLKRLKETFPNKTRREIESMAKKELEDEKPKHSTFYRLLATKVISGRTSRVQPAFGQIMGESTVNQKNNEPLPEQTVGFSMPHFSCLESCRKTAILVERSGAGTEEFVLTVGYDTEAGTAKGNKNFVPISDGQIVMTAGQTRAEITLSILDDGIYEEKAKYFTVRLKLPQLHKSKTLTVPAHHGSGAHSQKNEMPKVKLVQDTTRVAILDDDHCGIFKFEKGDLPVPDDIGQVDIKVLRAIGTKGRITVPYRIMPGSAKADDDYRATAEGLLRFEDGQFEQIIPIEIIDKNRFGEVFNFHIELLKPKRDSQKVIKNSIGQPKLGTPNIVQIGICENEETKKALDRLMKTPEIPTSIVSANWRDQIYQVLLASHALPYREDNNMPKFVGAILLYVIAWPWRIAVAVLPPARLFHGWLAYVSLLALMALVSTLISDCAHHLACALRLKNSITAITLIPIGMGMPDVLASRRAAVDEKTADAAIGSIFGANAVTIFLGIGLSWTIAAVHRTSIGSSLSIPALDLGFAVMLYCTLAAAGIVVLLLRRLPPVRGELGGPTWIKLLSAAFFFLLWLLFVLLSILQDYCFIPGFPTF